MTLTITAIAAPTRGLCSRNHSAGPGHLRSSLSLILRCLTFSAYSFMRKTARGRTIGRHKAVPAKGQSRTLPNFSVSPSKNMDTTNGDNIRRMYARTPKVMINLFTPPLDWIWVLRRPKKTMRKIIRALSPKSMPNSSPRDIFRFSAARIHAYSFPQFSQLDHHARSLSM